MAHQFTYIAENLLTGLIVYGCTECGEVRYSYRRGEPQHWKSVFTEGINHMAYGQKIIDKVGGDRWKQYQDHAKAAFARATGAEIDDTDFSWDDAAQDGPQHDNKPQTHWSHDTDGALIVTTVWRGFEYSEKLPVGNADTPSGAPVDTGWVSGDRAEVASLRAMQEQRDSEVERVKGSPEAARLAGVSKPEATADLAQQPEGGFLRTVSDATALRAEDAKKPAVPVGGLDAAMNDPLNDVNVTVSTSGDPRASEVDGAELLGDNPPANAATPAQVQEQEDLGVEPTAKKGKGPK